MDTKEFDVAVRRCRALQVRRRKQWRKGLRHAIRKQQEKEEFLRVMRRFLERL